MTIEFLNNNNTNQQRTTVFVPRKSVSRDISGSVHYDVNDIDDRTNADQYRSIQKKPRSITQSFVASDFNETQDNITDAKITALNLSSAGSVLLSTDPVTTYVFDYYASLGENNGRWIWTSTHLSGGSYYQYQMIVLDGKVYARIGDSAGLAIAYAGEDPGTTISSNGSKWKDVTSYISNTGGKFTGTFTIDYLSDGEDIQLELP